MLKMIKYIFLTYNVLQYFFSPILPLDLVHFIPAAHLHLKQPHVASGTHIRQPELKEALAVQLSTSQEPHDWDGKISRFYRSSQKWETVLRDRVLRGCV